MVFKDRTEMANYMARNFFGSGNLIVSLSEVKQMLAPILEEAKEKWIKESGIPADKIIDYESFLPRVESAAVRVCESFLDTERRSMGTDFARTHFREPERDAYDGGQWYASYSVEDLSRDAKSFAARYLHSTKREIEKNLENMCERMFRSSPPPIYSKEYYAFVKESEAEEKAHPTNEKYSEYNFAKVKMDIWSKTKDGEEGYETSFSTGVPKPPLFGDGQGILVSIQGTKEGFHVHAENLAGGSQNTVLTKEELLSMNRESFEDAALKRCMEVEKALATEVLEAPEEGLAREE